MNLDSLTFHTKRRRDGKWVTRCDQMSVQVTARSRVDAIDRATRQAFDKFYEIDAERRYLQGARRTRTERL